MDDGNRHYVYFNAMSIPVNLVFMNTSGQRLRDHLDRHGISYAEFAKRMGVDPQHVNNWFKRGVPKARIFEVADELKIDPRELAEGTPQAPADKARPGISNEVTPLEPLHPWDSNTPLDPDEVEVPLYKEVEIAAGSGRTAVRAIEGRKLRFSYATLRQAGVDPANAFCATVSGDSMAPLINHGATIGVDRGTTNIIDGEIYALEHDGMLRVKTLHRLPGGAIRLRSFNSEEFPDEIYTPEQIAEQRIAVLGWVFWWSVLRARRGPTVAR